MDSLHSGLDLLADWRQCTVFWEPDPLCQTEFDQDILQPQPGCCVLCRNTCSSVCADRGLHEYWGCVVPFDPVTQACHVPWSAEPTVGLG